MRLQATNNTTFEARKLRIPVNKIVLDVSEHWIIPDNKLTVRGNWSKIYENPNARTLYKQAQKTNDSKERIRLYAEMGHYDIVSYGQGLIGWFKRLFDIRKKSEKWYI